MDIFVCLTTIQKLKKYRSKFCHNFLLICTLLVFRKNHPAAARPILLF